MPIAIGASARPSAAVTSAQPVDVTV